MTQTPTTTEETQGVRNAKILIMLAVISVLVAIGAGVVLLISDPASGSTTEAALGITAAIAGLATAAFVIAAAIYAQARNLWRFVPMPLRVLSWILIAIGIVVTVWNLITQIA